MTKNMISIHESDPFARNRHTYGDKIRRFRQLRGLNQPQLAQMIGLKKNAVSNWEAGRSRPDIDILPSLCRALGVSLSEFFGCGTPDELSPAERALLRNYRRLSPYDRTNVDRLVSGMIEADALRLRDACRDRYLRLRREELRASAGLGVALDNDHPGDFVYVQNNAVSRRANCIITVSGDSMEPSFSDGDELLVEYTGQIFPGEIGIFIAAGEGFVKEYQPDGLHSHNPAYPVLKFENDDSVRCIGRVLAVADPQHYARGLELEMLEEIYAEK